MPYYVRMSRLDWGYDDAPADLQTVLRDANLELSSLNHTAETFEAELRALAAARPEVTLDALLEDGFRAYVLFRARGGVVSVEAVDERCEGALDREVDLPLDDLATVNVGEAVESISALLEDNEELDADEETGEVTLPLFYADEATMRAAMDRVAAAMTEGEERFVAEVDLDRFLIELRPGVATVHRLVIVTEPELVGRLLRGEYTEPPAPPPRPDEKREQALYFPESMLQSMKEEASRLDVSLSFVTQRAWKLAREVIGEKERDALADALEEFREDDKRKQTLFFPGSLLIEIQAQATRLDSSMSFVVQSAWVFARSSIAALPAQG